MENIKQNTQCAASKDDAWGHNIGGALQKYYFTQLSEDQCDVMTLKNVINSSANIDHRFREFVDDSEEVFKQHEQEMPDVHSAELHLLNAYVQHELRNVNNLEMDTDDICSKNQRKMPEKVGNELLCFDNIFTADHIEEEADNLRITRQNILASCLSVEGLEKRKAEIIQSIRKKVIEQNPIIPHQVNEERDGQNHSHKNSQESSVFTVLPSEVSFYDYEPGKFYDAVLEVKNISHKTQHCKIIPPKSRNFFFREGIYPGINGSIAPGLSCKFIIRFSPKHTIDYNDEVRILGEVGKDLPVPLIAKRRIIHLELPQKWSCGHCFLGERVEMIMTAINRGGEGKICLRNGSRACQITSGFDIDQIYMTETLKFSTFSISPACFRISSTEKTKPIKITFTPEFPGCIQDYVCVIYENLDIEEYIIQGEGIQLNHFLLTCTGFWNYPNIFEEQDRFTNYFLQFDDHYPFQENSKEFSIKNNSTLYMKYHWLITKPRLNEKDDATVVRTSCVNIRPTDGVLRANEVQNFNVKCIPKKVGTEHVLLRFVIENIPESAIKKIEKWQTYIKEGTQDNYVAVYFLDIDVKCECIQFQVVITPLQIHLPGRLEKGISYRHHFQMNNKSLVPVFFQWQPIKEPHIIYVQPSVGYLSAYSSSDFELMISPVETGYYEENLICKLHHQDELIKIEIKFTVAEADVIFEDSLLNLGLIKLGDSSTAFVTIRNKASACVSWQIRPVEEILGIMYISPNYGKLQPLCRQKIFVYFLSKTCGNLRNLLQLFIENKIEKQLPVFAEIIKPEVCLLQCTYHANGIKRCQPFSTFVVLHNQMAIDTDFHWGEPEGVDASSCLISFEQPSGTLKPKEEKYIQVSCIVCDPTTLHDLCVPCWIEGMDQPLYWSLSGDVSKPEVICLVPDDRFQRITLIEDGQKKCTSDQVLNLPFGDAVPLNTVVSRRIVLKNTGAIEYPFYTLLGKISGSQGNMNSRNNYSEQSGNKSSQRKVKYQLDENLKHDTGIAVVINPSTGILLPFSSLSIDIYCKTDMWGIYDEFITVKISQFNPFRLHLHLTSIGLPLTFPNGNVDSSVKLRFGRVTYGSNHKTRILEIYNNSPVDFNVEFTSFIIEDDDREKMIDLIAGPYKIKENDNEETDNTTSATTLDDKLLSVLITEHEGSIDEIPHFKIIPNTLTIPARCISKLSVTFHTPLINEAKILNGSRNKDYVGYSIGTVSLVNQKERHNLSKSHLFKNKLRFDYAAEAIFPRLFIDGPISEYDAILDLNIAKLLDNKVQQLTSEEILTYTLTSNSEFSVNIEIQNPFFIKSILKNDIQQRNGLSIITLTQSDIIKLKIQFQLQKPEIERAIISKSQTENMKVGEKNILYKSSLRLSIPQCDHVEEYLLTGVVLLPGFNIIPSNINFGPCLIGDIVIRELELKNESSSTVHWQAAFDIVSDAFSLEPTHGKIDPSCVPGVYSKISIKIYFKPKKSIKYSHSIFFKADFVLLPEIVYISGSGTVDSKFHHC